MITQVPPKLRSGHPQSQSQQWAGLLETFYDGLLVMGVPTHLAHLVRKLERAVGTPVPAGKRALVVEPDGKLRDDAIALLRETGLKPEGCTRAHDALTFLRAHGNETAFVFCDEVLAGSRDGIDLVEQITILWPGIHVVITADEQTEPPPGVVLLAKPWRALDLIVQAEQALRGTTLDTKL